MNAVGRSCWMQGALLLAVALAVGGCSVLPELPAGFRVGERFQDCDECPEMIVVSAGSYRRGGPLAEEWSYDDERPAHTVAIPRPFAVGVYEVTFAEWDACVADADGCCVRRPDDQGWGRGRRPVVDVNWADAAGRSAMSAPARLDSAWRGRLSPSGTLAWRTVAAANTGPTIKGVAEAGDRW